MLFPCYNGKIHCFPPPPLPFSFTGLLPFVHIGTISSVKLVHNKRYIYFIYNFLTTKFKIYFNREFYDMRVEEEIEKLGSNFENNKEV